MLQVRGSKDGAGFMVCGKDKDGRQIRIFVKHLSTAMSIKSVLNNRQYSEAGRRNIVDTLILTED